MSVRDELSDPWGWVTAGVVGGLGWAILAPVSAVAAPVGRAPISAVPTAASAI